MELTINSIPLADCKILIGGVEKQCNQIDVYSLSSGNTTTVWKKVTGFDATLDYGVYFDTLKIEKASKLSGVAKFRVLAAYQCKITYNGYIHNVDASICPTLNVKCMYEYNGSLLFDDTLSGPTYTLSRDTGSRTGTDYGIRTYLNSGNVSFNTNYGIPNISQTYISNLRTVRKGDTTGVINNPGWSSGYLYGIYNLTVDQMHAIGFTDAELGL